jgi:hypothetical protein
LYSLRRFCQLATSGNPTIITLLWLPGYLTKEDPIASDLIALRQSFISQNAGNAFLGYLIQQRKRLTGELSKNVNRPELVEKFGYDTKFASHALRLGYQGIEYLTDGTLTLPIKEPWLTVLREVKTGKTKFNDVLSLIAEAEEHLSRLVDACDLTIDLQKIDKFLAKAHEYYWELQRYKE